MPPMFRPRFLAAILLVAVVPTVAGQRASSPREVVATDRLARACPTQQGRENSHELALPPRPRVVAPQSLRGVAIPPLRGTA